MPLLDDWRTSNEGKLWIASQQQPTKAKGKQKGFWTDQISTGGGIGGALAGAAGGAAIGSVVPVVGTAVGGLIGALLGGGLGSAGGEFAENAIMGEKDLSKNVLKEGLIGGATSLPVGAGFKLARAGVKAASGIGKTAAGDLVQEAGLQTLGKGAATKMAANGQLDDAGLAALGRLGAGKSAGLGRIGNSLETKGNQLLGTQSNLTRAEARKIGQNPADVLGQINKRTGLTSLDDMAQVGANITGKNGTYSELTRNAIGNTPGIDLGDLRTTAETMITDTAPLLTGAKRQAVLDQIKNNAVKAYGGEAGSLSNLANPLEALDVANNFRKLARDITSRPTVQAADTQLAGVYNNLAKTIEGRLYQAPGIDEGLQLARGDRARELASLAATAPNKAQATAYERLAQELQGIGDVKSLRGAQKPFVSLSKIDEATARAMNGAGAQLGDNIQGLGRLAQKPTNLIALPLNAATPRVGGALAAAGRALQGGGTEGAKIGQSVLGTTARQVGGRLLTNDPPQDQQAPSLEEQLAAAQGVSANATLAGQSTDQQQVEQPVSPLGYSSAEFAQAMMGALAAGDTKAAGQLKDLYDMAAQFEADASEGANLNATTQKALSQSANAESTLSQLEGLLAQAGGSGGPIAGHLNSFMGDIGLNNNVKTYNDLASGSITQIAKALGETGAMSDSDRIAYAKLLPKVTDTPEVAANKFAALRARMAAAHENTLLYGGAGGDTSLESALLNAGL